MKKLCLLLVCLGVVSCATLTPLEKEKVADLEAQGLPLPHERVKRSSVAAPLNLLPGFGNFYLAVGTGHREQWSIGIANLFFWPLSVLWGIPEAGMDAKNINKRLSLEYYTEGKGRQLVAPHEGL